MVTGELLYRVWEAVVGSHIAGVTFTHDTNKLLDRDAQMKFPACGWKLPTAGLVPAASVYMDSYRISMLFVDQTASDRDPVEMLSAHARMEAIAKQCFIRFSDLYIHETTAFEGVDVDLKLTGNPVFTPMWDDGETMLTGVMLAFTVEANEVECVDAYFA